MEKERALNGPAARLAALVAIAFSLYQLSSVAYKMLPAMQHRAIHVSFALALAFLLYPASKKTRGFISPADVVFALLGVAVGAYIVVDYHNIIYRIGAPTTMDVVMGAIAIAVMMEACRRSMGPALVLVAGVFMAYALFGHFLPGPLSHKAYSLSRVIEHMYLTSEGIYGVAIYVTATFVFTFFLFGSFLNQSGGARAFIDIAFAIAGRFRGGPAKAAVVASGLMGMISGSSFANVVGTGTFTIPLMKKVGYRPEFAGGVEAAASSGGQIMPPVMGAAAFIMAEMTGIKYKDIVIYAAIPAILYYLAVFMMVDLEAARTNLRGLKPHEMPDLRQALSRGFLLLVPPAGIVYFLMAGYTEIKASYYAIILVILVSMLRRDTRLDWKKALAALESAAKGAVSLVAACAVAGLIVGTVTLTGLGLKFADLVVAVSGNNLYLALFMTMVASIVMGMGMPTAALYIILAAMVAPALERLGVPVVAAHLFIFYYGCFAAVTPPVALSSYVAAAIARADPFRTAFAGWKLASSAFIMPFIFAVYPEMLLLNGWTANTMLVLGLTVLAVVAASAGLEGYLLLPMTIPERAAILGAALVLMRPSLLTGLVGVLVSAGVVAWQVRRARRQSQPACL
ncbi:MAG: TRAP transporter permease [Firmicutes bacterium]|nr:TRAP transporter permease [Bacillota bacterium]